MKTRDFVRRPGVAINTAVLAAAIWIDGPLHADVRRVDLVDQCPAVISIHLGALLNAFGFVDERFVDRITEHVQ